MVDYFSFGTCVFKLVTGFLPWTNSLPDAEMAIKQYAVEYTLIRERYYDKLSSMGFATPWTEFLIKCLDPSPMTRANAFPDQTLPLPN